MSIYKNLDELDAYKKLQSFKTRVCLKKELTADRVKKYQTGMAEGLTYNFAAKAVNDEILKTLQNLANEANVCEKFEKILSGEEMNTGENRKVLHHLTRGQLSTDVLFEGENLRDFYKGEQEKFSAFAEKIHLENRFTTVVQIGIGGSDLGPRAMYLALEQWAINNNCLKMRARFISNVDPDDGAGILNEVDLAKTLFILVSKSGTTQETLANELFVKDILKKAGLDASKQMLAVTSKQSPLANNPDYLASFYIDDFIGGRYSSTSAVGGVILSLAFGGDVFAQFLEGATAADKTAQNADMYKNPSLLDALIGLYERNLLGYGTTAILPYSQALNRFPAHLQQADMESNGKQVNRSGESINYSTGPVIFGEPGTNGQHSFYQLLHQGTDIGPLQFVGFLDSQRGQDVVVDGSTSQKKLCANLAAQIVAFACGKEDVNKNKNFPGERPSSVIYGKELNPRTLGALLAHFENKIMFQGFLWNINSFDQEGVQLGKLLANKVLKGDTEGALTAYAELFGISK